MSQELWRDLILLHYILVWWSYFMMTPSNWNVALQALCAGNSPVTGEFPSQRPVTRSFDIFFELHLNIRLSKQSRRQWFETPLRSLWRHSNVTHILQGYRTSGIPYCSWTIVWLLQCQWSNPRGGVQINHIMMTSSNWNIFRVTCLLWYHRSQVNSPQKGSDVEFWSFLWSAPEKTVEQTMETPVIWDAIALIMTSL